MQDLASAFALGRACPIFSDWWRFSGRHDSFENETDDKLCDSQVEGNVHGEYSVANASVKGLWHYQVWNGIDE